MAPPIIVILDRVAALELASPDLGGESNPHEASDATSRSRRRAAANLIAFHDTQRPSGNDHGSSLCIPNSSSGLVGAEREWPRARPQTRRARWQHSSGSQRISSFLTHRISIWRAQKAASLAGCNMTEHLLHVRASRPAPSCSICASDASNCACSSPVRAASPEPLCWQPERPRQDNGQTEKRRR